MDWLLKLLGVSPKFKKRAKNISKLAKLAEQQSKAAVAKPVDAKNKASKSSIVEIEDLDYDEYEIVGESFYQVALEKHAGPKTEKGVKKNCVVLLVCESNNKFDKNAVRVELAGDTVGHLSRADAVHLRNILKAEGLQGAKVSAHAIVTGGWKRANDEGYFGIELDFDWDDNES